MTVEELVIIRAKLLDLHRPGWFADARPDLLTRRMMGLWPYTADRDEWTDQSYAFVELCDFEAEDAWRQEIGRRKVRVAV